MLLAEAAPVAPAAGYIMIGIGVCLLWVFLTGLKNGYSYSIGAFLRRLSHMVDDIWVVGGPLASAFDKADHAILQVIGFGLSEIESIMAKYWHSWEWLATYAWNTLAGYADDVYDTISNLVGSTIPQAVDLGTKPISDQVSRVRRVVHSIIDHELARFRRGIDSLRRDLGAERLRSMRGIDEVWSNLRAQLRALEHRVALRTKAAIGALRHPLDIRIGRLEALVGAGVLTGAAIAALTRVFPYWQCTNVKRFNRGLCRMNPGLLDLLFIAVVEMVGEFSIEDFARLLQSVVEPISSATHEFILEGELE